MKRVWKWIIGIVIVLVIVAVVVGGVFLLRNRLGSLVAVSRLNRPGVQVPGPQNVQPGSPRQYPGMRPFGNYGFGGPGMYMHGRGMMGFGGFNIIGGIIQGLFTLGILTLVVLGIIWLVSYLRRPSAYAAAVTPAAPVSGAAASAAPAATHSCPQCGELVQDNWKHCPNCGTTL